MLYKRNPKYIYYRFAAAIVFPLYFIVFITKEWFFTPFLVMVLFFVSANEFYQKNLRAIYFKEGGITFYYWEGFKKKAMFYKAESLSYYNNPYATGLQYRTESKLSLYYRGERIFIPIGNSLEGWSDDVIVQIVVDLEQAGVKKEKYLQY
jgi:hypothetical protein